MYRLLALILSVALLLSGMTTLAEESDICTYTVFNTTGELITELYITDNQTGEKSENYAGNEGLKPEAYVEINGINKDDYEVTLSFRTENGFEGVFETLHWETVPLSLLIPSSVEDGADATTGATPLSFTAPQCTYTVCNMTGERVTELYITDNQTGEKSDNYAGDWLADGASMEITGDNKAGYEVTLSFKTESGFEGVFETLHFETVTISLLNPTDATTGATPISFSM